MRFARSGANTKKYRQFSNRGVGPGVRRDLPGLPKRLTAGQSRHDACSYKNDPGSRFVQMLQATPVFGKDLGAR